MQLSNTEKAIHNYLLSLYAKHQPEQLMGYLAQQGDVSMRNYILAGVCPEERGEEGSVLRGVEWVHGLFLFPLVLGKM